MVTFFVGLMVGAFAGVLFKDELLKLYAKAGEFFTKNTAE